MTFKWVAGVVLSLAAAAASTAVSAAAPLKPKVLILWSFEDRLPWQQRVHAGLNQRLAARIDEVSPTLFEERLDAMRARGNDDDAWRVDYLRNKYGDLPFDLIVTEAGPAASFLSRYPDLFPGARRLLVHAGAIEGKRTETTLAVKEDFERQIRVALDLQPQARRLLVIGNLLPGRLARARAAWEAHFRDRVSYEAWSEDFSFSELYSRVAELSRDTVILYQVVNHDRAGTRAAPYEVLQKLSAAASVPVFATHDSLLGTGTIGGYVISGERVGWMIADLIAGASPDSFPDTFASVNQFDDRALKRWNISRSDLPADSEILYRELSLWEKHGKWIVFASVETLLLIVLGWSLRSRRRAYVELSQVNARQEDLIEERTRELAAAKEKAEAASLAKSAFLANMSHELRTPMNHIMGMTSLALGRATDQNQKDYLNKVDVASHHLLGLINDILDLSKIEAAHMPLEQIPFTLSEVIGNLKNILGQRAADEGLAFPVDIPDGLAREPLLGDPLRLGQILINLAGNAVKFTNCGHVAVRARLVEETLTEMLLRFEVADTGIGISAADQKRLFLVFEQADASTTRKYGGTGLGLALSKRLVQLMDGEIGVDSELGKGSTFWFTVRVGKGSRDAPQALPEAVEASAKERLQARHRNARVLIVEDEPVNLIIAQELLIQAGLHPDSAVDGYEAVDLAQAHAYDLILMDMQMPVLNGVDATRIIRIDSLNTAAPIVAMTANAFDGDKRACFDVGMSDFVSKPVTPERLYEAVLHGLEASTGAGEERPTPASSGRSGGLSNFDNDIATHIGLKIRLSRFVEGSSTERLESATVCRDDLCELGQWIRRQGTRHESLASYRQLVGKHADFHRCAGEVVDRVERNDRAGARSALGDRFTEVSKALVGAIMDFRQAVAKA